MQAPAPAEAASLQALLNALRARLVALLAEWPGHPVLSQLHAAAERLLGAQQVFRRSMDRLQVLMCLASSALLCLLVPATHA